jgi:cell division protein FtsQ
MTVAATTPHHAGLSRPTADSPVFPDWREWLSRGRLGWAVVGLLLVVLAVARPFWLVWFDHEISTIKVQGEFRHLSSAQLEHHALPWLGESFLYSDLAQVKAALEQEPWVQHAVVSRRWPGGLLIQVIEQIPIAYWSEHALLNDRGQLFRPQNLDRGLNLPRLQASELDSDQSRLEVFQTWHRLLPRLLSFGLEPELLTQTARGAWEVQLEGGAGIVLGTDELDAKIERLGKVLGGLNADERKRVLRIDLRYPNGAAVKWRS